MKKYNILVMVVYVKYPALLLLVGVSVTTSFFLKTIVLVWSFIYKN